MTYYNNYDDDFSQKPTYFMSNIKLKLLRKKKPNDKFIKKQSRSQVYIIHKRAGECGSNVKIPTELIRHIFEEFENNEKNL